MLRNNGQGLVTDWMWEGRGVEDGVRDPHSVWSQTCGRVAGYMDRCTLGTGTALEE